MKGNNKLLWRGHPKSIDDDVKIFIRIYWEFLTYYSSADEMKINAKISPCN